MRKHLFLLFIAFYTAFSFPQKAKGLSMRCASVGSGGEVTVTWETTGVNPSFFRAWYIYYSTGFSGPYTLIDSSTVFNNTTGFHASANAFNQSAYYFVSFQSTNGSAPIPSDTIRPIGLNVINPNNGFANLSWNPLRIPLISTNQPFYRIFREYPSGVFTLIDSVDARSSPVPMVYNDLISICDDTIKYRIEVMDNSGCISVSPLKGDRFKDLQPPSRPQIDSVSVDANGNVIIAWKPSSSLDTRLYQMLQLSGGLWVAIDTVFGRTSTIYNSTVSAANASQSFQVIAKDSCNNPSSQSAGHATIYLRCSFQVCGKKMLLNWTPYGYWGTPVQYEILVSVNGGAETLLDVTTSTSYTDTSVVSGSQFCYRVRAREIGTATARSSTSNRFCLVPSFPPLPAFSYLRKVSVLSENSVQVTAYVDPSAVVSGYRLERALSPSGPYSVVRSSSISGTSLVEFTDQVEAASGPYYYRIITLDSCGLVSKVSNYGRTVLCTASTSDYVNLVNWISYQQWTGGVHHYDVYRSVNGVFDTSPAYSLSSFFNDSSASDPVLDLYASDGEFCYFVEAIEAGGNPYGFRDTARSNVACVKVEPIVFIPNAFRPGGEINKVWKPSGAFLQSEGYELRVFDRWGRIIFSTNDPLRGWDGSYQGSNAPIGVYVYQLKAKNENGGVITRTGSVALID